MNRQIVILVCVCSALVYALPVPDSNNNQQELDIVQIPIDSNKELDILSLSDEGRLTERNKRTIGILRDLFPELSKQVEDKVNQIVGQIIRALGPTILRTAIQGNANRARNDFDSDFDDDDDDSNSSSGGTRVQIDLPTFSPDDDDDNETSTSSNGITTENNNKLNANGDNSIDLTALNQQLEETIRVARQTAATQDNSVSSSETDNNNNSNNDSNNDNNNDQLQQASESKAPAIDELTLDIDDDADDRNKRFLNLGFGGTASGGTGGASVQAGGSVAGSGNFLFDIIRRTADRAARAAGTVYRVVAGTEKLDLNSVGSLKLTTKTHQSGQQRQQSNKIDRTARTINDGLFSGSIQTQGGGDDRANDASSSSEDTNAPIPGISGAAAAAVGGGYTEGIPGPVTRLVVLANRGLANLIQDLILRIAATSERLVNFKARLITALI